MKTNALSTIAALSILAGSGAFAQQGDSIPRSVPVAPTLSAVPNPERPPLVAAKKVRFGELPLPVQNRIRSLLVGVPIENFEKGTLQGKPMYDAALKRNGQKLALRVAEDGTLIKDDINDTILAGRIEPAAVGKAPDSQRGTGGGSSSAIVLENPEDVTFGQLPAPVLSAIQSQAGAELIRVLQRGTVNGQTVYQANVERGGQEVPFQIADDGSILTPPAKPSGPEPR